MATRKKSSRRADSAADRETARRLRAGMRKSEREELVRLRAEVSELGVKLARAVAQRDACRDVSKQLVHEARPRFTAMDVDPREGF